MRAIIILSALLLVSCSQASADNVRGQCINRKVATYLDAMCIVKSPGAYEGGDTIYFNSFQQGLFKLVYDGTSAANELALEDSVISYNHINEYSPFEWNEVHTYFNQSTPGVFPATGYTKVYTNAGNGLCTLDSFGVERCTAVSGPGSSSNSTEVLVALTSKGAFFTTTVTGLSWVTASSMIVCAPLSNAADSLTAESVAVANPQATVTKRTIGVGFDLLVTSPNGLEGTVRFACIGV